jgi:Tfp pilus assembly protein PilX
MRRLTTSQEGIALPVATAMLLVISLFVIAFFSVTLQVNETSVEDRSSKRALAAAEAGLQMALYRMNEIGTTAQPTTPCFTTAWVAREGGQCPLLRPPGQLGNGATYTYTVAPGPTTGTGVCVGADHCVTAVGTVGGVGGVQRRVQVGADALTTTAATSYKTVGLMSKSLMYAGNSSEMTSEVGSNGVIHFGNSAKTFDNSSAGIEGDVVYGPLGSYTVSGSSQEIDGDLQQTTTPFVFDTIDFEVPENSASNVLESSVRTHMGSRYAHATRTFSMSSGTYTFLPGTYHFCRVRLGDGARLSFSTSAATQIYVDSPSRGPDSSCYGLSNPGPQYPMGTFWAENSNRINEGGREELLEIFMHGTAYNGAASRTLPTSWCNPSGDPPHTGKCKSDFLLSNSSWFEGMVNAPNTTVELNNSGEFKGAIAADTIRFNNSVKFELTAAVRNSAPTTTTSSGVERGNWVECRPQAITADPGSGC